MNLDTTIQSKELMKAFELMQKRELDEAKQVLQTGLDQALAGEDKVLIGLFHSAWGAYYKLKNQHRKSYNCYQKAERCIPDDPSLKIITARLLVEYFAQYDSAIKKMNQTLKLAGEHFSYLHQAFTIKGLAYLKKGNLKKVVECLQQSMGDEFKQLDSLVHLDLALVSELIKKKKAVDECRHFLNCALDQAQKAKEPAYQKILQQFIKMLP